MESVSQAVQITPLILPIILISTLLGVLALIITHYMTDHDTYRTRLMTFRAKYWLPFASAEELRAFIQSKVGDEKSRGTLQEDYLRYRLTVLHFGFIDFVLQAALHLALFSLALLAIYLEAKVKVPPPLDKWMLIGGIATLAFYLSLQIYLYFLQGNAISRRITELVDYSFEPIVRSVLKIPDNRIVPVHKDEFRVDRILTKFRCKITTDDLLHYLFLILLIVFSVFLLIATILVHIIFLPFKVLRKAWSSLVESMKSSGSQNS